MNRPVYLRPLQLEDAQISYKWRNDPKVWTLTGSRPDRHISLQMEADWLANVLQREDQRRFAVCLAGSGQYVGNIHLEKIEPEQVQYGGLFIGEPLLWGKGLGTQASTLLVEYAFRTLNVEKVYGFVRKEHEASINMLRKIGFETSPENDAYLRVLLTRSAWQKKTDGEAGEPVSRRL